MGTSRSANGALPANSGRADGTQTRKGHLERVVSDSSDFRSIKMAPEEGLEPPTSWLTARRSTKLSYSGIKLVVEPAGLEPATSTLRTLRSPN